MDDRFIVRRAVLTDIIGLSELNQHTFCETFVDDFSLPFGEDDLQCYFRMSTSPEILAKKIADPEQAIWIVIDKTDDKFVAFAIVSSCALFHSDVCAGKDGEISRIYVRRDRQGYGLGQCLMNVALSWLEEQFPGRPVWVEVWSGNLKAIKFYEKYNFKKIDDSFYPVGKVILDCFIMRRENSSS